MFDVPSIFSRPPMHSSRGLFAMFRRFPRCTASLLLGLIASVVGCAPATSGPAASASFDQPIAAPGAAKTTRIVLILPAESTEEHRVWEQVARTEAGLATAIFELRRPESGEPATRQGELVREAAGRGASALIVVAENAQAIAPALAEARDRGVPIVLLDRPVDVPGRPLPLVTCPPFDASARALVKAAMEEAKAWQLSPQGPALILVNSRGDAHTEARVAALKAALEDAGVTQLDAVHFGFGVPRPLVSQVEKTVVDACEAHPELAMVLADDDLGITGAEIARESLGSKGRFALVGFTANPKNRDLVRVRACAALVDVNVVGIARQAVRTALQLIRGETVGDRIEVPFQTHRAAGPRPADAPFYKTDLLTPSP
jgi:D-xylose transport system substrate-binding protein